MSWRWVRGVVAGAVCGGFVLGGGVAEAAGVGPSPASPPGERGERAAAACRAGTGPYQRQLEKYLGRTVDGRQSAADCAAVRDFQVAHKLHRRDGYAGLETYRQTQVEQARKQPNAAGKCPVRTYRVVCVDMTRQLLWTQTRNKVGFGPVATRTGRYGQETRTGWHRIFRRVRDDVSRLYDNAPMPYAQYFDRGQALHGHPGNLYDGGGSAGCVNLRLDHARELWKLLGIGDKVYVWGRKPGT